MNCQSLFKCKTKEERINESLEDLINYIEVRKYIRDLNNMLKSIKKKNNNLTTIKHNDGVEK